MFKQGTINWLAATTFFSLTLLIGYTVEQQDFSFVLYSCWFVVYLFVLNRKLDYNSVLFFLFIAVLARIALVPAFPLLSDDVYRFIWDGRLIVNGENPFSHLPTHWMKLDPAAMGLDQALFNSLNSSEYFTIYPPISQAISAISQLLAGSSIYGAAIIMKILLVAFEIGSLYFIFQILNLLQIPIRNSLLYALNPLVIIEISGNIHFEGAMIFFFLFAIWLVLKKKLVASALMLSLSVASKLLPLMFLPFVLSYYGWKKGIKYCLLVGLISVILFIPFFDLEFIYNFSSSLDLYFQKFEFNGSIYFFLRWLGELIFGYNIIQYLGPILAIITILIVGFLAYKFQSDNLANILAGFFLGFVAYLFLGTTIHPWYLSIPILLSVFTNFKFPIVWSLLIMLTYLNYQGGSYRENLSLIGLEYILVFSFFSYELYLGNVGKKIGPGLLTAEPTSLNNPGPED